MGEVFIIPDPERLEESLALSEAWNAQFEYNDFFSPELLENRTAWDARIQLYRSLDRDLSRDTLHGAFLDVTVHSTDPLIRHISEQRVEQSMQAASALGVRGVVFHTGLIPNYRDTSYTETWLRYNRVFWAELCRRYPEIEVFMENMFDEEPDRLLLLAEAMSEHPNFGVCLDCAHAQVFGGGFEPWLETLSPHIRHMHINDNDGKNDLHDAVGDGVTDWAGLDRCIRNAKLDCSVLIETQSIEKQQKSLSYMRKHRLYPFE